MNYDTLWWMVPEIGIKLNNGGVEMGNARDVFWNKLLHFMRLHWFQAP
jgi:hypothetical protein